MFHDALGRETFYVADFYCHELRLVIELDGEIHLRRREEDKLRTSVINHLGITVLRFKNKEVENDMDGVVKNLRGYIKFLSK